MIRIKPFKTAWYFSLLLLPLLSACDPAQPAATLLADAEARWQANPLDNYTLSGRVRWVLHEHTFRVEVRNGQVADSSCELTYDQAEGPDWCSLHFDPTNHHVPALFETARDLIRFGEQLSPAEPCFYADFDPQTGVPRKLLLDCAQEDDEQEEWVVSFEEK